jgi:hypothetical protein
VGRHVRRRCVGGRRDRGVLSEHDPDHRKAAVHDQPGSQASAVDPGQALDHRGHVEHPAVGVPGERRARPSVQQSGGTRRPHPRPCWRGQAQRHPGANACRRHSAPFDSRANTRPGLPGRHRNARRTQLTRRMRRAPVVVVAVVLDGHAVQLSSLCSFSSGRWRAGDAGLGGHLRDCVAPFQPEPWLIASSARNLRSRVG